MCFFFSISSFLFWTKTRLFKPSTNEYVGPPHACRLFVVRSHLFKAHLSLYKAAWPRSCQSLWEGSVDPGLVFSSSPPPLLLFLPLLLTLRLDFSLNAAEALVVFCVTWDTREHMPQLWPHPTLRDEVWPLTPPKKRPTALFGSFIKPKGLGVQIGGAWEKVSLTGSVWKWRVRDEEDKETTTSLTKFQNFLLM